jgi:DNA-binding GntR family transcriptional regulator
MPESIQDQYKTITQLVVENLRKRILTGQIKAGERINQDVIAKEFNVSKIPIREALQLLRGEGFVLIEANKGALATTININQIDELFELKALIEADLLAASLPLISEEKLTEAQQLVARINSASSPQQWNDLNLEYYNCLYSGIRRPQTEEMLNVIKTKIARFNYACFKGINKTKQYVSICKLLDYCVDREIDQAVKQLKQHLGDSKDEMKTLL